MLTEKGRRLLSFMQRAFEELTSGVKAVNGDSNPQVLRISTVHSFCSLWLIPRLQEFQNLHPEIMVQLAPSGELIDFKQSDIDLAIRMGRGGYADLTEKKIYDDNLIFVASPKLLVGIDKDNPEQIFRLPWIEDTSIGIQESFQDYCKRINFKHETLVPVIQTNDSLKRIIALTLICLLAACDNDSDSDSDIISIEGIYDPSGDNIGSDGWLLIHTIRGEEYIADNILAETLIHEAVRSVFDKVHAGKAQWLQAQQQDIAFISTYAEQHHSREDLAESFLPYLAVRYKPDRLSETLHDTINTTIEHRINYFDSLDVEIYPMVNSTK